MTADPAHSPIALLTLIFAGLIVFGICAVYLCSSWAQRGGPPKTTGARWKDLAVLCGAGAIACYVWGVIHLVFVSGDSTFNACMEVVGRDRMAAVNGYEGQYLPLRLVCSMEDGGSYVAGVPGYVNPVVGVLTFIAVVSVAVAIAERWANSAASH